MSAILQKARSNSMQNSNSASTPRQQMRKQQSVKVAKRNSLGGAETPRSADEERRRSRQHSTRSTGEKTGKGNGDGFRMDERSIADAALTANLEQAKLESTVLWSTILAKQSGSTRPRKRGQSHRQTSDGGDDEKCDTGGHDSFNSAELDEDEEGEEGMEERVNFTLPPESVTGYPTPKCLIHPTTPLKIKWDLLIGALILYSVMAVPFRLGFRVIDTPVLFWSDAFIDLLFGIDIVATFCTAFYDDNLAGFETNPWKIAARYLGDFFLIDLLSTIPFDNLSVLLGSAVPSEGPVGTLMSSTRLLKILRLARLLKLMRLVKLGGKAKSRPEEDPKVNPTLGALVQMMMMLFFIGHLLGCLWFMILDEDSTINWLNRFKGRTEAHESTGLWDKYAISLYWAFTTMTTVGFGDIVGTTSTEYMVVLFGMLVGASVFGYVIGNVTAIMETFDPHGAMYKEKMGRVKSFIMDRGFPPILARRIKYHFKHQLHRTTVFDATSAELVAQLPPPAACAVAFSEFRSTLKRITFLRVHPPMFVKDVLQCMKSFTCNAGDYINRDQDMGLCLFLLETGTVKRYLEVCPTMTSLIERASQVTPSDVKKPPFSRSSSTDVEAQLGTPLELALSLALPLGFSVEWVHIPGSKGALMVVAVEAEEQALVLGVRVGMWLQFAGGLPMASVEQFEKELSKRSSRGEATCNLVLRSGGSKYLHFDTLTRDSVFGEAPLVLHSKQFVTSVAATNVCELWFVPKDELFVLLDQWPEVKASLVTKACDFLNDVLDLYMEHNHANCPESIQEMAPHAQLDDILEDVVSGDASGNGAGNIFEKHKKAPVRYLRPDVLVATMAGVSDPTDNENIGGRARMVKHLKASFRMPRQGSGNVDKKALLTGKSLEARFGAKDPLQSSNLPSWLGINTESSGTDNSGRNPSASSSTPSPRSKAVKEAAAQAAIADRMEAANNYASDEDERAPGFKTIRQTTLDGAMTPRELMQRTGLFHPESPLKMVWDVLMSHVILYSVITITYQIGFASYFTGALKGVDYAVDISFAADILASFNTAAVDVNGNLISSRKQVSHLYLTGWFPIDFISTLPIDLIIAHFAGSDSGAMLRSVKLIRAVRLVRLVKIVRIIKLSGYVDKMEDNLSLHPAVLRLLNLFVIMGFFAHLFACLLYSVAQCDDGSASDCWIENYCVGGRDWFDDDDDQVGECLSERGLGLKYLVSIYWAFTTMTTIGYGDITPNPDSTQEVVTMMIVEVLGTTIFAYVVGSLVGIIVNLNPGVKMRRQNMQFLNQYLTDFQSTLSFRRSLRLHSLFRLKIESVFNESDLLAAMPPDLRQQTNLFIHGPELLSLPSLCLLEAHARGAFTVLLPLLRPYCFSNGDAVIHPMLGTQRECFFVSKGTLTCTPYVHAAAPSSSSKQRQWDAPVPPPLLASRNDPVRESGIERSLEEQEKNKGQNVSKNSGDGDRGGARDAEEGWVRRYRAGDVVGEVPMLLPDGMNFTLKVEVRAASSIVHAFGLQRLDYATLSAQFPDLATVLAGCLGEAFEANFTDWVNITSPKDWSYEDIVEEAKVRYGTPTHPDMAPPSANDGAHVPAAPPTTPAGKARASARTPHSNFVSAPSTGKASGQPRVRSADSTLPKRSLDGSLGMVRE